MSDRDAILRAICADPRDDTPRLAYAVWLEENADAFPEPDRARERARFVRADVAADALPEWDPGRAVYDFVSRRLADQPWSELDLPPLPDGLMWGGSPPVRRGFPWLVQVLGPGDPLAMLGDVPARYPVEQVEFAWWSPDFYRLATAAGWLPRLSGVRFGGTNVALDGLLVFLESPEADGLEELHFRSVTFHPMPFPPDAVAAFLRSRASDRLTTLSLIDCPGAAEVFLRAVGEHSPPPRLRSLDLRSSAVGAVLPELVANLLHQLYRLNVSSSGLADGGLEFLTRTPAASNLKTLILSGNPFSTTAVQMLFDSPHLAELKVLDLSYCELGDAAFSVVRNWPLADRLVFLNLAGNPASDIAKRALKQRMGERVRV
jgi:uncharacterized protein (TIGR02996 family)